ncbi:MAG: hypothetical protein Q8L22_11395, partial [Reyranella sp.]|nr:hypothetical protein [Reyranella sp.]
VNPMLRPYLRARRVRWFVWRCIRIAFRGSIPSANNLSPIIWPLLALLLFEAGGRKLIFADGPEGQIVGALAAIGAAWVIVFLVRLVLAPWHLKREGKWLGNEFIFHVPKVALLTKWLPQDNGHPKPFSISDAPPGCYVIYEPKQDSPGYFSCTLDMHPRGGGFNLAEFRLGGGSILYDGKPLWLFGYVQPDSTGVIVRILIKGYTR